MARRIIEQTQGQGLWNRSRYGLFMAGLLAFLWVTAGLSAPAALAQGNSPVAAVDDDGRVYVAAWDSAASPAAFANFRQIGSVAATNAARGLALADFDRDGDADLIVGCLRSGTLYFYSFENDGTNQFTFGGLKGTMTASGAYAEDMAAGDFNNDGHMDFLANSDAATVALFLGDGKGNFTKLADMNLGTAGRGLDAADFNLDGNLDFVRAKYSSGTVTVYLGNGDGTFNTAAPVAVGTPGTDPYGVAAGDFNGDGIVDVIAIAGSSGDTRLYKGAWDGTTLSFTDQGLIASLDPGTHASYDAFDYNGDGILDLVASDYTNKDLYFYPGNGDGTFGARVKINPFDTTGNALAIAAPPSLPPAGVPTALVAPAAAVIAKGGSVDFDGSGSSDADGTIASWLWTFGDGGTDNLADPPGHAYAAEGTFMARLKVTDNTAKSGAAFARVTVQGDAPAVDATPVSFGEAQADNGIWTLPLDGAAYATDAEGIVSYQWTLGDGLTEGFESGLTGWQAYAGTWALNSATPLTGSASYHQTDAAPDRTWTLHDKVFDGDIAIEADVKLLAGAGEEVHLLFRARDQYNNYELILRGRGYNDVLLYKRVNGTATALYEYDLPAAFAAPSYPVDLGQSYRLKVLCRGGNLEFYLDGRFLFAFADSTFLSGRVGFSTYKTAALFDSLAVTETAAGRTASHPFAAGTYPVQLTVTDAAGQSATGTIPVTAQPGAPPVARAGGPYAAGESAAFQGGWTVSLNGAASTDDVEIRKYLWDMGTDAFSGTAFNSEKWHANGGIVQNEAVSLAGASTWDTRYLVTKALFPKVKGQIFQARIKLVSSGQAMFGFKNVSTTNFHYNQFPYAFYLYSQNVQIYENTNSRGDTGFRIAYDSWYDFRIELKETGALYSYKPAAETRWTQVYDSSYTTADTSLKKGLVVHSSTGVIDDFRETTAGATPSHVFYGLGDHPVTLTVYDRAGQSGAEATSVVTAGGAVPAGPALADQTKGEAEAQDRTWTFAFDASGITDDVGVYRYEWDWNHNGASFTPSGDTGATASHTYGSPGAYTVAVRVTDHALQSSLYTLTVTATQGNPPTARPGGPYSVDEFTGSVSEGGWTVSFDGSLSSDGESSLSKYVWDLGADTFTGTAVNPWKWVAGGKVTQNDQIAIATTSTGWGKDYLFSRDSYPRAKGMAFEARVNQASGTAVIGFKNTNTTYHKDQMPYALWFNGKSFYIYEDGASRGDTGIDYSYNTWYEVRIELKETAGARYYYRAAGAADWILLYDSNYGTASTFKRGVDVNSGTFYLDDVKEIAAGATPSYRFYGLGPRAVSLTVYDKALQSHTDASTVTILASAPPTANAGADKSGNETSAFEGTWTLSFSGASSSDDKGICRYEWDWAYDGAFDPSGDTGSSATHTFAGPGTYTVALRVTDHALQSTIDTVTVTLTNGAPPTAEAGAEITTEGIWPVVFNGGGSADDVGIYRYAWTFGDGKSGTGKAPSHIYWTPGDYTATLTVYDSALQSASDTVVVHVLAAAQPPVAHAGGPYLAGAGGPPAHFNGSGSTDDYGIVKYLWDADIAVDSDNDGNPENDVDAVGRNPFYTYAATGLYTAKLTVVDGAGQSSSATAQVSVAGNLAPEVLCVPWRAGDPTVPHETYNGRSVRLKAVARDAGTLQYKWAFGDGTFYPADGVSYANVTDRYAIEASHTYPASADGTPYTAVLTVKDSAGLTGTDSYYLVVKPDSLDTRTNVALDEALWYLHKTQNRTDGHWASYSTYHSSATSSSIQAFEINGHLQTGDHRENPYVETVNRGLGYLFTTLAQASITSEPAADSNGNGIGIQVNSNRPIYEGGMALDAIASSNTPLGFATTGGAGVKGRYFHEIVTDMVDMYAWGQVNSGTYRGGWQYSWNSGADNSACQWAAIGMLAAEETFGINIPQFVKNELNTYWLTYSYDGTGFGYTGAGNGVATTPSGMVQLAFADRYTTDPRWRTAEDYIANNWFWQANNYYAVYSLVKALRLARPYPVVTLSATGLDWYNDPTTGVRKRIVDQQAVSGTTWGSWASSGYGERGLDTAWAVIMLTPTLFVQPPVADAGQDIIWAYGLPLAFDASGSYHHDPSRRIVKYEWDFDGDGTWDFTTTDPKDPQALYTYPDPHPEQGGDLPMQFFARLRVTDDNEPAQTKVGLRKVTVAEPPHAPFAVPGGPYRATAGIPFTLDGSGSHDVDLLDGITRYQWDLDSDGAWFDNVEIDTAEPTASYQYNTAGVYNIGLKVWDKGAFNPAGCTPGVDCTPMVSLPSFTSVTVAANVAPVIAPNVTYTVNQGSPLTLGGGGLVTDPNGDSLTYGWDFTGSGAYTGSTEAQPAYTWYGSGSYTVGVKASDSVLETTGTVTVQVQNVAPSVNAGPDQTVARSTVTFHGGFTDPGASAETYTATWNFGDGTPEATGSLDAVHTYRKNGIYTATLTVTDSASGVGADTLTVTVAVLPGDVDQNGVVNLADAILALQVAGGLVPPSAYAAGDANSDQTIGLEEVIYILQVVSGLRP